MIISSYRLIIYLHFFNTFVVYSAIGLKHTITIEVEKLDAHLMDRSQKKVFVPAHFESSIQSGIRRDPFDGLVDILDFTALFGIREALVAYSKNVLFHYDTLIRPLESPEGYDVGISEGLGTVHALLYRRLGVRREVLATALAHSSHIAHAMAVPMPPSFVPNPLYNQLPSEDGQLSFSDRLGSLLAMSVAPHIYTWIMEKQAAVLAEVDPSLPTPLEALGRSHLLVLNMHPVLYHFRPSKPQVIAVGGIAIDRRDKIQKLPENLEWIVTKAQKGVVVVSFGSLVEVELISDSRLSMLLSSFAAFPEFVFICKLSPKSAHAHRLFANLSNVHAVEWLPQRALLAYPRTRAFISHMGLNSYTEAAVYGVPLIAIPLFGDQFYNAATLRRTHAGVVLAKDTLTADTLRAAIHDVIGDKRYAENARRIAAAIAAYPRNPRQEFVREIEFLAIHGDTIAPKVHLPFVKYYNLDVIGALLLAFVLLLAFLYFTIIGTLHCAVRLFRRFGVLGSRPKLD